MIAGRFERLFDPLEKTAISVANQRSLSVHQLRSTRNLRPENLGNALMAEADAKNRDFKSKFFNQCWTNSGVLRAARARRNANALRAHRPCLFHRDLVVAFHCDFRAELAEVLHQVVSERVVVIDY